MPAQDDHADDRNPGPLHGVKQWLTTARSYLTARPAGGAEDERWQWGSAVLRVWPDGTHDLLTFSPSRRTAARRGRTDQYWWQRTPAASPPLLWSLVDTTRSEVREHRNSGSDERCARPECRYTPEVTAYLQQRAGR